MYIYMLSFRQNIKKKQLVFQFIKCIASKFLTIDISVKKIRIFRSGNFQLSHIYTQFECFYLEKEEHGEGPRIQYLVLGRLN